MSFVLTTDNRLFNIGFSNREKAIASLMNWLANGYVDLDIMRRPSRPRIFLGHCFAAACEISDPGGIGWHELAYN